MEIWLLLCVIFLAISTLLVLALTIHLLTKAQIRSAELADAAVAKVVQVNESQTKLLDKTIAILSTKEPMAFQAMQVMNDHGQYTDGRYDPSDEAEVERLKAFGMIPADAEGDPNGYDGDGGPDEDEWLIAHGVPGEAR